MGIDFNTAPTQQTRELIPDGTTATVHLTIRPGNHGEGGWLKLSKSGESQALDCEFTVVDGPYAKRKFWTLLTLDGMTPGQQQMGNANKGKLRAAWESAHGIRPDDMSAEAQTRRNVPSWGNLDGLRFVAKIDIEKGKDGYSDKNVLGEVVTPDKKAWVKAEQVAKTPSFAPQVAAAAVAGSNSGKPAWAS